MSRRVESKSRFGFKEVLTLGNVGSVMILVSLASSTSPVKAEDNPPVEQLPPIIVEGSRTNPQAERIESVTVITRETIEEDSSVSAYDIFKRTPGVNVGQGHVIGFGAGNRSGGPMTIRGIGRTFGGNRVRGILTTIDDIPDVSLTHGHPFADIPTLENVERIEIIKGPSTVLDGGGAMAGLIKITTLDPAKGWHSFAQGSGGSFGTTEDSFRVSYGGDHSFALLSGNYRRSDGHRLNTQFEGGGGQVKLGHDLGEKFKIKLSGGGGTFNFENPAEVGGSLPNNKTGKVDHFNGNIALTGNFENSETSAKFYILDADLEFNDGATKEPNQLYGAKFRETLHLLEGNSVILGLDWLTYDLARNNNKPEAVSEIAPYLFVEQTILDNLKVNGGFRVSDNEQFGTNVTGEGGLVFVVIPGTSLRGRIAEGYRPPSIIEISTDSRANIELKPTELIQYEVGVNQQFGQWGHLDVVVFLQEGDNIIRTVPIPGGTQFANTGVFSHRGIEAQATMYPMENLDLFIGATILDVEDDTALVPQNTIDFGAKFKKGNISVAMSGRHVSRLFNADNSQQRIDDYTIVDVTLNYFYGKNYRFFVDIDNVTDESYEVVQNFPLPGISAFAGFSANF